MSSKKMDVCKHCGAEIAVSAKTCPQCGGKNKKPIYKRGWFIALCVIVVIAAVSSAGGEDGPTKVGDVSTDVSTNVSTDVSVSEPVGQTRFAVGEKVELKDVLVTLKKVTESTGANFMEPEQGNVFLVCEFDIENNSDSEIAVSSLLSFEAYVDDYATSLSLVGMASADKPQLDGSVSAGKKMNGVIAYEVSKEWKEIEINFTPDVWSNQDIVFFATK